MEKDHWNPEQYEEFKNERSQPFFDLLALVKPKPDMRVIDLGCGTGELTQVLHRHLNAAETIGLDSSKAMLSDSHFFEGTGLHFTHKNISDFDETHVYDLIFSNAALQWCPDHKSLFETLRKGLRPGGQFAVQMPSNYDHPAYTIARELAGEAPFKAALKGGSKGIRILRSPEYSEIFYELGYKEQHVRIQVYPHILKSKESVIEWVKGTMLTFYESRLPKEIYSEFFVEYKKRVLAELKDSRPFFYPFKRILLWARAN